MLGDPHRLQQILVNLLENGIKFTEEGEIRLSVHKADTANDNVTIAFAVADTGIGIPEEKQAAIFEHFTQAERGTERQYGGTGLGLAICDHLVALQGGKLSLESEVGKGSVFQFSLTYQVVSQQVEPVASETRDAVHESEFLSGLRVLVADDNAISRLFMGRLLKAWGCTISMCHHGKEVVNTLKAQEFDLVLMDVQMPQLDGYAATRIIREDLGISADDLPILAITANAMKGERDRCQQAGMNDYLSKPFEPADLQRKLLAICPAPQPGARSPKVEQQHDGPDTNGGKSRQLDLQYLIKAAGGDRSFVLEIIRTFLENHPTAMQELADLIEAKKWKQARSSAHAIAPTFRYIGEARGADLTGQLEEMAFQEVDELQEDMVAIM
ncbi:MAG: ATP-binding protein, partial [Bacteroidota bacterium]